MIDRWSFDGLRLRFVKRCYRPFLTPVIRVLLSPLLWSEAKLPRYPVKIERGIEYKFALECLLSFSPVAVLDVGPGESAWPHLLSNCGYRVTAIDKVDGYWRNAYFNRHYLVKQQDIRCAKFFPQFDAITCISTLEHIPDHCAAVNAMFAALKPAGLLVLTIPYNENEYVPNAYALVGSTVGKGVPYILQIFSRSELDDWLRENQGEIVAEKFYRVFEGDLWTLGERIHPPRPVHRDEKPDFLCLAIRKQ